MSFESRFSFCLPETLVSFLCSVITSCKGARPRRDADRERVEKGES